MIADKSYPSEKFRSKLTTKLKPKVEAVILLEIFVASVTMF